jgi:4-hydroxy-tetrahydrodipicolinate synthase
MQIFTGTGTALITPFNEDYTVDKESLKKLTDHQINEGIDYLVVLGTTGESVTLSKEEKKLVVNTIRDTNKNRVPIVLGIGGNNTKAVTEEIENADLEGISGILSVSPYYNKPNQEGIYRHYSEIARVSPLPVILYNVPGRTGSNVSAETTIRLANDHENITTVKEASGNFDQCMEIIENKPIGFEVVSGEDALTLPLIAAGMQGVISVVSNAFPSEFSNMVRLARNGKLKEATEIHYKLLPYIRLLFADGSPGGVKALLSHKGQCKNVVRPPLAPVSDEVNRELKRLG